MTEPSTESSFSAASNASLAVPGSSRADQAAVARLDKTLDRIERLGDLLACDPDYAPAVLDFELPADFKLSIVVPVYNEESTIHEILARIDALPLPKEIIIVDDSSTDGTRDRLKPLEHLPDVKIIYQPQNEGKGAALRTGFAAATGSVVAVQDADLEYDPRDLLKLIKPILDGDADVVYGSRFLGEEPQDPSFVHRFGNGLLTKTSNLFTRLKLTDMETCYKVFRRNVLRGVTIKQNRFGFEPEITAKVARRRYRVRELPIHYHARGYQEGKKIGIRDALNAFYCIVRYWIAE